MTSSVLVVAAHPDDEVLGCGGVVARHVGAGDTVNILLLAEGAIAREPANEPGAVAALQEAAAAAAHTLGASEPRFCGFPDNRLDSLPLLDVIKAIEDVVAEVAPKIVYTHPANDLNVDHRIVHQAAITACRPLPGSPVQAVYAFETVSSTEWQATGEAFRPQRWIDIEPFLELKLRALDAYTVEMRPFPHARSREAVEALARVRGAAAGLRAAECFMVVREVVR